MTEKQEHLLILMREIDEICKKHHLRYVMAGGSLIGVVRNEGFIPWDDDVDIYMPRDDWNKFVELSRTEFPPDRTVHCVDVDREYTNTFPRYADTASCAVHRHQLIGNDKAGEIIDVLTLDPIPPDDREYEKYRTHMLIYSELVNVSSVYSHRFEVPVSLYLKYLLSYYILGRDRTLKKLEKIMFSYKEEDCTRYAMRWGGCPFLFDKDMLFPVKYRNFEGISVMIPQRTSDYLIWHYGDEWSYIPPHDERTSHNAISVEGITYQELRDDYMKKVDAGRIRRESVFRKIYQIAAAKKRYRLLQKKYLCKAKSVEMDLEAGIRDIRENGRTLPELVEKREFSVLNQLFDQYFRVQLDAEFIGREDFSNIHAFYHPILLEIPDEAFEAAMMTLLYTERVAKAYRMLQLKEKLDHLTPQMLQLKEDIELFRKAACHYEMKENEQTEEICCELLERYPDDPGFMKLYCRVIMERSGAKDDFSEGEAFLAHALDVFPDDGYFLKYRADIICKKEGRDSALPLYAEAREKTNNGITHLEIEKYLKTERADALKRCRALIEAGREQEALSWLELWERLLPEDEIFGSYRYLVQVSFAETGEERKSLKEELEKQLKKYENLPEEKKREQTSVLGEAMEVLLKYRGYPRGLARLGAEMLFTVEREKLQGIAERLREYEDNGKDTAIVCRLEGDAQYRMGCTGQAFFFYQKALDHQMFPEDREEIADLILWDLYKGGRKAAAITKKADAMEFLNKWLDKYGDLQQLQELPAKMLSYKVVE